MNSLLVVNCVLLMVCAVHCSNEVPVLAWGSGSELFNFHIHAHQKLSTAEFRENFIGKLVYNEPSAIVTFVEESLSPEDLVDTDESSAYPLLQKTIESENSAKYLPYVSNPVKAFEALNYEKKMLTASQLSQYSVNSSKELFVVALDDVRDDESRLKLLQRHDRVIHEFCSKIQKVLQNVVCVLTAERPSWIEPEKTTRVNRKLLQSSESIDTNSSSLNVYYNRLAGMIYTKSEPILMAKNTNETFNLSLPTNSLATKGNNALVVQLMSSLARVRLSFNFILPNMTSTWLLNSVKITFITTNQNSLLKSNSYIGASLGNSFHTPRNVIFENDNYTLSFDGLQVQYFATPSGQVFGPAEDSVYFFTIPILSGLFVTTLLVTIILIGITMIFDIKTMDQFDDAKGKSITINVSE